MTESCLFLKEPQSHVDGFLLFPAHRDSFRFQKQFLYSLRLSAVFEIFCCHPIKTDLIFKNIVDLSSVLEGESNIDL